MKPTGCASDWVWRWGDSLTWGSGEELSWSALLNDNKANEPFYRCCPGFPICNFQFQSRMTGSSSSRFIFLLLKIQKASSHLETDGSSTFQQKLPSTAFITQLQFVSPRLLATFILTNCIFVFNGRRAAIFWMLLLCWNKHGCPWKKHAKSINSKTNSSGWPIRPQDKPMLSTVSSLPSAGSACFRHKCKCTVNKSWWGCASVFSEAKTRKKDASLHKVCKWA